MPFDDAVATITAASGMEPASGSSTGPATARGTRDLAGLPEFFRGTMVRGESLSGSCRSGEKVRL
jgi:hypothetical protein